MYSSLMLQADIHTRLVASFAVLGGEFGTTSSGWKTGWLCSPHLQIELWGLLDHLHAKTDNLFWISINWDFKESNFSCTLDTQGYSPTPFLCFSPSCPFKPYLHILSSKFLPRFLFFFQLFFPLSLSVVSLYPLIYYLFCGSLSLLW